MIPTITKATKAAELAFFLMILEFSFNFIDIIIIQGFIWKAAWEISSL